MDCLSHSMWPTSSAMLGGLFFNAPTEFAKRAPLGYSGKECGGPDKHPLTNLDRQSLEAASRRRYSRQTIDAIRLITFGN